MIENIKGYKKAISYFNTINPKSLIQNIQGLAWYHTTYRSLKKQKGNDQSFFLYPNFPILHDRSEEGGTASGHYFHQDLYVARMIYDKKPKKHVDIGSRVDGFVAHVAVFREIEVLDIRPLENKIKNIKFKTMDCMNITQEMTNYCDSISSLHAIEHFGLGRYGDPIDYYGHLKALDNIAVMLQKGGIFYLSVPIGPQRIEFNAHRVFSIGYLLDELNTNFYLESFSYVNDEGDFFEGVELNEQDIETNYGCNYGCGIFICIKK